MLKVGITGQPGFMGSHLARRVQYCQDDWQLIPFADEYYDNPGTMAEFAARCDVIVHLAAVNRHQSQDFLYNKNIELAQKLLDALDTAHVAPHLLFSSSIQEQRDNHYGRAKKQVRQMLATWAKAHNTAFTGLVIPNVFGPFGKPFYNAVTATFCHQLVNGQTPVIQNDATIPFISVDTVVESIISAISQQTNNPSLELPPDATIAVSKLLQLLTTYKQQYLEQNIVPDLPNKFEVNLFNTLRSYLPRQHYPVKLLKRSDNRGHLAEVIKSAGGGGQAFFSSTKPGITRGNHFHLRKVERFCVVSGKACIRLRKIDTDEVWEYNVNGDEPTVVDMPVQFTHNITNTGNSELLTLFWTNEIFNPEDPDTYYLEV